jgi:GNAT superfamily N-acetyltransferase
MLLKVPMANKALQRTGDHGGRHVIALEPMTKEIGGFEFAFAAKREALGPYIEVKWGWDESFQRSVHSERWAAKSFFRIVVDGEAAGTVAIDESATHVQFGEFYLLPPYQRRGIGGQVLATVIEQSTQKRLPVRLECLKWNPALSLYKRAGFLVTREDDIHYFMERPCL